MLNLNKIDMIWSVNRNSEYEENSKHEDRTRAQSDYPPEVELLITVTHLLKANLI